MDDYGNLVQHIIILIGTIVAAIGWYITRKNLEDERRKTAEQKALDDINLTPGTQSTADYQRTIAQLQRQIEELQTTEKHP